MSTHRVNTTHDSAADVVLDSALGRARRVTVGRGTAVDIQPGVTEPAQLARQAHGTQPDACPNTYTGSVHFVLVAMANECTSTTMGRLPRCMKGDGVLSVFLRTVVMLLRDRHRDGEPQGASTRLPRPRRRSPRHLTTC